MFFCSFLPVNKEKIKTADRGGVGESGGGSVFVDFYWAVFSHINAPWSSFFSAADSLSGHRGPLLSSAGLISSSSSCFSPPFSRLLLFSSGYGAKQLTANREGLPWETEKGEQRGAWGYFSFIKNNTFYINNQHLGMESCNVEKRKKLI